MLLEVNLTLALSACGEGQGEVQRGGDPMKTFALVTLAVVLLGGPIALAGQETLWTGTRPNDYFDLLLLKESTERWVAIVGLVVIGVLAVVVYARTSHVRSEVEKKIEDEFNEIKQRYDMDLDPKAQVLTENQRLQNLKDVFQTIAQGQAALWTPK
jgi:hypothetical protein